jgi:hypothetical protein
VDAPLKVQTWVPTKLDLISPLVDWLMNLITAARCFQRNEDFVELALREALSNAMIHGNRLEAQQVGSRPLLLQSQWKCPSSSRIRGKDSIPATYPIP